MQGDGNWLFGSLPLDAFKSEDRYVIVGEMVCDYLQIHRNIAVRFIKDDFNNYINQFKKNKNMGWRIRNYYLFRAFRSWYSSI